MLRKLFLVNTTIELVDTRFKLLCDEFTLKTKIRQNDENISFATAVCVLFLLKLKWPKNKSFYDSEYSLANKDPQPLQKRILYRPAERGDHTFSGSGLAITKLNIFNN